MTAADCTSAPRCCSRFATSNNTASGRAPSRGHGLFCLSGPLFSSEFPFLQCSALDSEITREALHQMLKTDRANSKRSISLKRPEKKVHKEEQVDEPITFGILSPRGRNADSKVRRSVRIHTFGNSSPE